MTRAARAMRLQVLVRGSVPAGARLAQMASPLATVARSLSSRTILWASASAAEAGSRAAAGS
jgi:hypothetical protein